MKAVILAGGLGTRITEETNFKPKPMIEIGGKPILWHVMKLYSSHGINDFIICLGYKGYVIKEYFVNYYRHMSDLSVNLQNNSVKIHNTYAEPWKITLVNTGEESMTGGRIKRISSYLNGEDTFCLTYGDGLSDVDISGSIDFHKKHGKHATVTAVQPAGRFGVLEINNDQIIKFQEKPKGDGSFVNGGFFVLSPKLFDYINEGDGTVWEQSPLKNLASDGQLMSYKHQGFFKPIATLRDKIHLVNLWNSKKAPWKIW